MAVDIREGSSAAARAETASIEEVVMLLRAVLGPELVSSIAGNTSRGCVAAWAQGRDRPGEAGARRLRIALELVLLVMEGEGIEAARSWLLRHDRTLEGRSPLEALAQQRPLRTRRTLLAAAAASLRRGDAGPPLCLPAGRCGRFRPHAATPERARGSDSAEDVDGGSGGFDLGIQPHRR